MLATLAQRSSARRAAPITSLPDLILGGGELSEVEKATMIGRTSHRRALIPASSPYCKVYAQRGDCPKVSMTNAVMALSAFRVIRTADRERVNAAEYLCLTIEADRPSRAKSYHGAAVNWFRFGEPGNKSVLCNFHGPESVSASVLSTLMSNPRLSAGN